MNTVYLLTGGNLGKREQNLANASELIEEVCGPVIQRSSLYQTAAWGPIPQPDFLNQALHIETSLAPRTLMTELLNIEHELGRHREERYSARNIDIDILFYNDLAMDEEGLIIPNPRLYSRRFVLEPMNEIAPALIHPILQLTIAELLAACNDPLDVKKYIAKDATD